MYCEKKEKIGAHFGPQGLRACRPCTGVKLPKIASKSDFGDFDPCTGPTHSQLRDIL